MLSFIRKIFGNSPKPKEQPQSEPLKDLPVDELFVQNYRNKGGIFIYCQQEKELIEAFEGVLLENHLAKASVFSSNPKLEKLFKRYFPSIFTPEIERANIFLTDCEYLIADSGAILFCSNQLVKGKKPSELPEPLVVVAKTSQIVRVIREAMGGLKEKYKTNIPTNIVDFQYYKKMSNEDFTTYGKTPRKTYLFLLEDLI